jgi:hypothetical protein
MIVSIVGMLNGAYTLIDVALGEAVPPKFIATSVLGDANARDKTFAFLAGVHAADPSGTAYTLHTVGQPVPENFRVTAVLVLETTAIDALLAGGDAAAAQLSTVGAGT